MHTHANKKVFWSLAPIALVGTLTAHFTCARSLALSYFLSTRSLSSLASRTLFVHPQILV